MNNKRIGLICDIDFSHHILFKNYYFALKSLFNDVKLINNINDVFDIDMLVIANDHFGPHRDIWENDIFINKINIFDLTVVVFSTEKIMDSYFPWNSDIQNNVNKFKKLYQYVLVDDIDKLNKKHHRCLISKYYKNIVTEQNKLDKAVFIGNTNSHSYNNRIKLLSDINNIMSVDIIESTNNTWIEYIETISKYRFVFSPLGNMDGFPFL